MYDAKATAARVLAEYGAQYAKGGDRLAARYNPGARVGEWNDCAVRALHIVSGMTYEQAHERIASACKRKPKRGAPAGLLFQLLDTLAPSLRAAEKLWHRGQRPTLARWIDAHPRGVYYVTIRTHALAVIDGKIIDSHLPKLRSKVDGAWKFAD